MTLFTLPVAGFRARFITEIDKLIAEDEEAACVCHPLAQFIRVVVSQPGCRKLQKCGRPAVPLLHAPPPPNPPIPPNPYLLVWHLPEWPRLQWHLQDWV